MPQEHGGVLSGRGVISGLHAAGELWLTLLGAIHLGAAADFNSRTNVKKLDTRCVR